MFVKIVVLAVPLLVAGCGGRILQSEQFPARVGFSYVSLISDATSGGTGADVFFEREPGEIIVGHEHLAQPRRVHQHYFRGAAFFDLSRLSAIPNKVVNKAVLEYRLRASAVRDSAGTPEPFPLLTSCASQLLVANTNWLSGDGVVINDRAAFEGEPFGALPTAPPAGGGTLYSVDVTSLAQRWVVRPEDNLGMLLRGAREAPQPRDKSRCTSRYSDIKLRVDYTVFTK